MKEREEEKRRREEEARAARKRRREEQQHFDVPFTFSLRPMLCYHIICISG